MAEYAMVTAAVAFLAVSLIGAFGKTSVELPRSAAAALELVDAGAKAKRVAVADARAAYRKAPYRKPALKYVYAVGWITGTKNRESCFFTVSTSDAVKQAATQLRSNAKVSAKLKRRGLTPTQAGTALVKGIQNACS